MLRGRHRHASGVFAFLFQCWSLPELLPDGKLGGLFLFSKAAAFWHASHSLPLPSWRLSLLVVLVLLTVCICWQGGLPFSSVAAWWSSNCPRAHMSCQWLGL